MRRSQATVPTFPIMHLSERITKCKGPMTYFNSSDYLDQLPRHYIMHSMIGRIYFAKIRVHLINKAKYGYGLYE